MPKKVRVRFAPSPTGGLHLGGVRTVLYNYLFARQHGGDFILRIEDTDQGRFVHGAEQYILDCLSWCGLEPDESPVKGGHYGPYRQSERKQLYRQYAETLVASGNAYYAFDTTDELESMRARFKTPENPSPQYNQQLRTEMRNSLTLPEQEVKELLQSNTPHVIRIRVPDNENISFVDMIRGQVNFNSSLVDDKVLLKADGMPTYHLAVVVDDYLMKVTHAFRGEEWLPSAPIHILLWNYLGWINEMPEWAHLPLILKPDGKGKLSKRDGDRLGFPVFAMDWKDPTTGDMTKGFRELGFLPEAFINLLALMGWNDGTGQEVFTKEELIEKFSLERVHTSGAKFDYEKAKWFNHEWIKISEPDILVNVLRVEAEARNLIVPTEQLQNAVSLVRDRCVLLTDLWPNSSFLFQAPSEFDLDSIKPKWSEAKTKFFNGAIEQFTHASRWEAQHLEEEFKTLAVDAGLKPGDVLLPLRIMLVGKKSGPAVFDIAVAIGKEETISRISAVLSLLVPNK